MCAIYSLLYLDMHKGGSVEKKSAEKIAGQAVKANSYCSKIFKVRPYLCEMSEIPDFLI